MLQLPGHREEHYYSCVHDGTQRCITPADVFLLFVLTEKPWHVVSQIVGELAVSPIDKFMRSLEDMMAPQKPQEDGGEDQILTETSFKGEQRQDSQDLDGFRRGLIKQTRWGTFISIVDSWSRLQVEERSCLGGLLPPVTHLG